MTHIPESHAPRVERFGTVTVMDPILLELGLMEVQQDNARLRQIIAELLVKNQALRWALRARE